MKLTKNEAYAELLKGNEVVSKSINHETYYKMIDGKLFFTERFDGEFKEDISKSDTYYRVLGMDFYLIIRKDGKGYYKEAKNDPQNS